MKKNLIYCAVAALALSSCMKDEVADVVSGSLETITFEAAASAESKTTLVDGKKVYWCSGDQISVAGAAAAFTNSLAEGETAAKTAFTGDVATADVYYSAYPYSAVVSWAGAVSTLKAPMRQTAVAGTFADGQNLAVASTTSQEKAFTFQNVLGYAAVTINVADVKSVYVTANGGEPLYGQVTVDCSAAVPAIGETVSSGSHTVTLTADETFATGTYYVALLPGTYSEGLTFDFVSADGRIATKSLDGPIELKAGCINTVGTVAELTWTDPAEGASNVIWKGKFVTGSWDNGMTDLAYGRYDWSKAKVGDVLKIYGGATSSKVTPTLGVRNANWSKLAGLNDYYNNPKNPFTVTLTEEMITDLTTNSGLVIQGDHYYLTRIELGPAGEEPGDVPEEETLVVWEGSQPLGEDWGSGTPLNLQYLRNVVPGSVLYIESTNEEGASIKLADVSNGWENLPGTGYYGWSDVAEIALTDEAVAIMRANGVVIQGIKSTVTKVYFTYPTAAVVREEVLETDIMINDFEEGDGHSAAWDNSWAGYAVGNATEGCLDITESGKHGWLVNCNHVAGPVVQNAAGYDVLVDVYVPKGWLDDGTNKYQIILDGTWYWVGEYMFSTLIGNDSWQTVRVSKLSLPETIDFSDANDKNEYGSNGISTEEGSSLPVGMKLDNFRLSLKK